MSKTGARRVTVGLFRRLAAWLLWTSLLAGLLCGCSGAVPLSAVVRGATPSPTLLVISPTEAPFSGYLAPDFILPDLAGQPVNLHSYRGHPVWINLWATWCVPCQIEMPEMQKLYDRYKSQGLVILGLDVQEDQAHVADFVTAGGFTWQFLLDADGKVARRYYLTGMPMHVFVDAAGVIRAVQPGGLATATMEEYLRRIMDRPAPTP